MKTTDQIKGAIDYGCVILPPSVNAAHIMFLASYLPEGTPTSELSDMAMEAVGPLASAIGEGEFFDVIGANHECPDELIILKLLDHVSTALDLYHTLKNSDRDSGPRLAAMLGMLIGGCWMVDLQDYRNGADLAATMIDLIERKAKDHEFVKLIACIAASCAGKAELDDEGNEKLRRLKLFVEKGRLQDDS